MCECVYIHTACIHFIAYNGNYNVCIEMHVTLVVRPCYQNRQQ